MSVTEYGIAMYFSDYQPGYGKMFTIAGVSYIFSLGYHLTSGDGYFYTDLTGCSCFEPEYVNTGDSWTLTY